MITGESLNKSLWNLYILIHDCVLSYIFLYPAWYDWRDIMFPGCHSFLPSVRYALGVPLCVQRPAKAMPFQRIIMHALQCQHDLDVHLLFCVDLDLHITSFRGLFRRSSLMGTTLRAAPSKSYTFSTNYHACIAMPTWPKYTPPILFWPWPPYNLCLRSCLTWIFSAFWHQPNNMVHNISLYYKLCVNA